MRQLGRASISASTGLAASGGGGGRRGHRNGHWSHHDHGQRERDSATVTTAFGSKRVQHMDQHNTLNSHHGGGGGGGSFYGDVGGSGGGGGRRTRSLHRDDQNYHGRRSHGSHHDQLGHHDQGGHHNLEGHHSHEEEYQEQHGLNLNGIMVLSHQESVSKSDQNHFEAATALNESY